MRYTTLGRSGLVVSRVAFGNSLTHGNQVDDGTARSCVRTALDAGINTFDTADAYAGGRAEEILGRALGGLRRTELVICTKVGRSPRPGPNEGRLSRKHIVESAEASLRRLGTDYVDLYQAHRWDAGTPLEETMTAFADLVRAGKVLYAGVSEWRADQIHAAAALARELGIHLIANQAQYSMLWRVIEAEVVPACADLGIGQMVWSPLAGGVLTGKYRTGQPPPAGSRVAAAEGGGTSVHRWRYLDDAVLAATARLGPLAAQAGLTPAQLALAWVLRNPAVSTAVIGASRPDQLTENLAAVGVELAADLVERIDRVLDPVVQRDPTLTGRAPAAPAAAQPPPTPPPSGDRDEEEPCSRRTPRS